jgi:hypothetical protein
MGRKCSSQKALNGSLADDVCPYMPMVDLSAFHIKITYSPGQVGWGGWLGWDGAREASQSRAALFNPPNRDLTALHEC